MNFNGVFAIRPANMADRNESWDENFGTKLNDCDGVNGKTWDGKLGTKTKRL